MSNVIKCDFQGHAVSFTDDGWFNATRAAKAFGKRPVDWLRLPDTKKYIEAKMRRSKVGFSHFARMKRGGADGEAGTWLHPQLAVAFARWLDVDFAAWCDEQIDELIRSGQRQAIGVYLEILALQREDATSFAKASLGSRLMNERKRQLPGLRERQALLEQRFAPDMFRLTGAA